MMAGEQLSIRRVPLYVNGYIFTVWAQAFDGSRSGISWIVSMN